MGTVESNPSKGPAYSPRKRWLENSGDVYERASSSHLPNVHRSTHNSNSAFGALGETKSAAWLCSSSKVVHNLKASPWQCKISRCRLQEPLASVALPAVPDTRHSRSIHLTAEDLMLQQEAFPRRSCFEAIHYNSRTFA